MSDRRDLQAVQERLKQCYREEPSAARVTVSAAGALGEGVTCSVSTGRAMVQAGLHPATGGDGLSLRSGDMLLEALVACAGVTLRAVATSLELPARGTRSWRERPAEGDIDFRCTLSVAKDTPVGFSSIRLRFEPDTDGTDEQLDTLIRLTERYCAVLQTIRTSPKVTVSRASASSR